MTASAVVGKHKSNATLLELDLYHDPSSLYVSWRNVAFFFVIVGN